MKIQLNLPHVSRWRPCNIVRSVGIAVSLLSASYAANAAQQILWYPFDDPAGSTTLSDASGHGYDADIIGGVTLTGGAAHFDGIDGYIDLPDNLLTSLNAISITAEIFIENSQPSPYFIYGLGNISGAYGDGYLFTTGNHYRTTLSSCHWSCEQSTATASANLPRGSWQHIAYTQDNNLGILYLNGVEVARNDAITLMPGTIGDGITLDNFLGRSLYSADNYFYGDFADFQIWNGALSPEEIAATVPQLVLWYPFDDAPTSSVITDASGNNHHGTVEGGVTLDGDVAELDGKDAYIDLPDNLMAGLDEITVMTKVFIENDQPSPYFIYGLGNTSGSNGNGYLFTTGNYYRTTLSTCHWSCEQNTGTSGSNLSRGEWHHLAYSLKGSIGIVYLDGVEVARNTNITITPADIGDGTTLANFLGRSLYSGDNFLHGRFDDFQIWNGALSASVIATTAEQALAEIQLDDAESVAADSEALAIVNVDDVRGHIFLATQGKYETSISWSSDNTDVITPDGLVTRAPVCVAEPRNKLCGLVQTVTLTATITKGEESATKTFIATVPPLTTLDDFEAYMFSYFTGEGTADGEQVYFALSNGNNPLDWQTLNSEQPVLSTTLGEKGARDPFIIRSPEGDKFFMIATDLKIYGNWDWGRSQTWGSRSLLVWESNDLVNWSDARLVQVSPDTAGNTWAPEAFWDPERNAYVVFWASKIYNDASHSNGTYNKMMYALTRDFVNFSDAQVWVDEGYSTIDSTLIKHDDVYYRFTKDERSASESACGKFILSETSTTLNNDNWDFQSECIGKGDMSQGEGPLVFKSNTEQKWYLFIDEFGGRGYIPFETTDLSSGNWSLAKDYTLPSRPRHGTVLPVTAKEYRAILNKWGKQMIGDFDGDFDIDSLDVSLFYQAIRSASISDLAYDFNHDGQINRRDLRGLTDLCTRARCATH
ncbi:LamG-like jellyroll fold domain-containing protein [Agarivorans sp. Z349TD_8]|uniref:LamG-like jellyroll fold domain-containing protein n=1 Tax=Agarivorans sp. Z349TD_8 TaxID=3421434 RepID=UPI003D7CD818